MLSSKLIPLTGAQKNSLMDVADAPIKAPSFALTGEANPNLRVFIARNMAWNP
ncbi:hypothetical protein [Paucibacter soli]|uniref:hypothetical protein n=1 Tax=Paucibacter soli TaxID=3133433 RepID=UPI0030A3627A